MYYLGRLKLIAKITTSSSRNHLANPGDLVIVSGRLCTVLNKTHTGYLLRDCNSSISIKLDEKESIRIVKNIQIQNG